MTLVHINMQAFPPGNCLFWRLSTFTVNVWEENFIGGPVCLEMLSVTNPPVFSRAVSKHKLGDETGEVADGGSNFQSDKKSWLTRTLTVSIDQCRMEPSKKIQPLHTNDWTLPGEMERSTWAGSGRRTTKGSVNALKFSFEPYLVCRVIGKIPALKAFIL